MAVWYKCKNCKGKYYSTEDDRADENERCYKCGGRLKRISHKVDETLDEGSLVEVIALEGEDESGLSFKVQNISTDLIVLNLCDNSKLSDYISENDEREGRFTTQSPIAGMFIFKTRVLSIDNDEGMISIEKPNYVVHV